MQNCAICKIPENLGIWERLSEKVNPVCKVIFRFEGNLRKFERELKKYLTVREACDNLVKVSHIRDFAEDSRCPLSRA